MDNNKGLVTAYLLDGEGGGESVDWQTIDDWSGKDGFMWVHLDYSVTEARQWLEQESGLGEVEIAALTGEDPRPRTAAMNYGLLVILRGANLNPGADPEDMVSLRLWVTENRIISTRKRKLLTSQELTEAIEQGRGPTSPGDFLVDVADHMAGRMMDVVNDVVDRVDALEDLMLEVPGHQLRPKISELRREAISLRRYLVPQREAMTRLYNERVPWLSEIDRLHLREVADRTMRYIEDLDAARERAIVVQEELVSRISEQMDKRMYVLSMVAAIFLPLGFLTGLLGINVGGIPGAEYQWAFIIFCLLLAVVVIGQFVYFKKKKWF